MQSIKEVIEEKGPVRRGIPTVSATFKDGGMLEMVCAIPLSKMEPGGLK